MSSFSGLFRSLYKKVIGWISWFIGKLFESSFRNYLVVLYLGVVRLVFLGVLYVVFCRLVPFLIEWMFPSPPKVIYEFVEVPRVDIPKEPLPDLPGTWEAFMIGGLKKLYANFMQFIDDNKKVLLGIAIRVGTVGLVVVIQKVVNWFIGGSGGGGIGPVNTDDFFVAMHDDGGWVDTHITPNKSAESLVSAIEGDISTIEKDITTAVKEGARAAIKEGPQVVSGDDRSGWVTASDSASRVVSAGSSPVNWGSNSSNNLDPVIVFDRTNESPIQARVLEILPAREPVEGVELVGEAVQGATGCVGEALADLGGDYVPKPVECELVTEFPDAPLVTEASIAEALASRSPTVEAPVTEASIAEAVVAEALASTPIVEASATEAELVRDGAEVLLESAPGVSEAGADEGLELVVDVVGVPFGAKGGNSGVEIVYDRAHTRQGSLALDSEYGPLAAKLKELGTRIVEAYTGPGSDDEYVTDRDLAKRESLPTMSSFRDSRVRIRSPVHGSPLGSPVGSPVEPVGAEGGSPLASEYFPELGSHKPATFDELMRIVRSKGAFESGPGSRTYTFEVRERLLDTIPSDKPKWREFYSADTGSRAEGSVGRTELGSGLSSGVGQGSEVVSAKAGAVADGADFFSDALSWFFG